MTSPISSASVNDPYNESMLSIQNTISADQSNGNIAAANALQAQVNDLATVYNEENQLNQQITDDVARMAGDQPSGSSNSSNSSSNNPTTSSSTPSPTPTPTSIFTLFNS